MIRYPICEICGEQFETESRGVSKYCQECGLEMARYRQLLWSAKRHGHTEPFRPLRHTDDAEELRRRVAAVQEAEFESKKRSRDAVDSEPVYWRARIGA